MEKVAKHLEKLELNVSLKTLIRPLAAVQSAADPGAHILK